MLSFAFKHENKQVLEFCYEICLVKVIEKL